MESNAMVSLLDTVLVTHPLMLGTKVLGLEEKAIANSWYSL